METPPDTGAHLAGAIKRLLWQIVAIGHNRAELVMVEMQQERARAQEIVFLAAGISVFGVLAALTLTAVIACACKSHLLLALCALTVFYCLGALFFYVRLMRMLRDWDAFTASREQIEKDRECLEKRAT
ncbi:MAG TPA: phage holin family protein [Candidatus Sulfotelmatobacter sp.]|nr:phage holin family protein [Candidatus Sulfotelmatobacter sp.]